jgi:hypothetical protein
MIKIESSEEGREALNYEKYHRPHSQVQTLETHTI